jgi:hypothetical protein
MFIEQQTEQTKKDMLGVIESISDDRKTVTWRAPGPADLSPEKLRNHALTRMKSEIQKGADWMGAYS